MNTDPAAVAVHSRILHAPKAGYREDEYEDAEALLGGEALPFRAAVADGATESAFARAWAEYLVDVWTTEPALTETAFQERLPAWQAAWEAAVTHNLRDLPWYAAAKVEQGAFAAFLGLSLEADGTWKAVAVGDCCLFVLSQDADPDSWPLTRPEQFTSTPALVPSRPGGPLGQVMSNSVLKQHQDRSSQTSFPPFSHASSPPFPLSPAPPLLSTRSGTWKPSDTFVLATDAAAAWLLRTGPSHARSLTAEDFPARLDAARAAGELRNDDVTLVVLELALAP